MTVWGDLLTIALAKANESAARHRFLIHQTYLLADDHLFGRIIAMDDESYHNHNITDIPLPGL